MKLVLQSGNERFEYFDAETGLQIGSEAHARDPAGPDPVVTILRDYRKYRRADAAREPDPALMGIEQMVNVSTYEFDAVPADAFDLPPAIKALIK